MSKRKLLSWLSQQLKGAKTGNPVPSLLTIKKWSYLIQQPPFEALKSISADWMHLRKYIVGDHGKTWYHTIKLQISLGKHHGLWWATLNRSFILSSLMPFKYLKCYTSLFLPDKAKNITSCFCMSYMILQCILYAGDCCSVQFCLFIWTQVWTHVSIFLPALIYHLFLS